MKENELILISLEEIIEINKKFNGGLKRGDLEFIMSKIKSLRLVEDYKMNVARVVANLWYYIIQNHIFVDGNKRTATEASKLSSNVNSFEIDLPPNGFIYVSLKIANSDIKVQDLINLVYSKLKVI